MRKGGEKGYPRAVCTGQVGLILHLLPSLQHSGLEPRASSQASAEHQPSGSMGYSAPFARNKTSGKTPEAEGSKKRSGVGLLLSSGGSLAST